MKCLDKNDIITYGTLIIGRHYFSSSFRLRLRFHSSCFACFGSSDEIICQTTSIPSIERFLLTTLFSRSHSCSILYYRNESHLKNLTGFCHIMTRCAPGALLLCQTKSMKKRRHIFHRQPTRGASTSQRYLQFCHVL